MSPPLSTLLMTPRRKGALPMRISAFLARPNPNDGRAVENQVERHTARQMVRLRLEERIKQVGVPVGSREIW